MKRLILSMSLVAFAILIAFVEVWYINYTAADTIDDISRITSLMELHEKEKALESTEKIIEKWETNSRYFNIFLLHEEIEAISENLEEINQAIKYDDRDRFFEVSAKTKKRLVIIKEDEFPLLDNVL